MTLVQVAPIMQIADRQEFPRIAFAVCVLFYLLLVLIGFNDIEEDAFIYFRFAQNIANGHGYVFNIGGEHIEACSGLLWLGLVTLLTFLPLHIVLATKLLCFVFGVLCIREVLVLSRRFIADRFISLLPAFLMVASIPFYLWSVRGLETAFYWFVMLWLVDWATDPARIRFWWLPALALLNARPEGFVMLFTVLPYLFFCERRVAGFWRGAVIVATGFVAVSCWRLWYFHDLVPHPFYFKVNTDFSQSLRNLATYGWYSGWGLLLLLSLPGVTKVWQKRDLVLLCGLLMSLLWAVFVFEDKIGNRHTGIALPFVYIVTLMLLARWLPSRQDVRIGINVLLSGLLLFTLLFSRYVHFRDSHQGPFLGNAMHALMQPGERWSEVSRILKNPDDFDANPEGLGVFNIRYNLIASVGDFIRLNYRDDVVVVYDQIGQAPWYAGPKTFFIDNLGLGYREIGLAHFHKIAGNSMFYSAYESLMENLVRTFWPDERRNYTEEEILDRIMARWPYVVIARKGMLADGRESLLSALLHREDFLRQFDAAYLLNNREIVFERHEKTDIARRPVQVPPGATMQKITAFNWCSGSPCMALEPLH